ncbi:inactive Ufm1-specific protease 1 [Brachionus plicatilis]|uniref:Inactive Ufm1-specific protease 1 n=1 Tax=Brachionus plicatilis TaxID=10195 RepID=A0A3M7SZ61_BRAPC|nr:inactive Ufm1-specific protease 1 [Brachionus plicatilis]
MSQNLIQLEDFYLKLKSSEKLSNICHAKGIYDYYHYCCDGYNDIGFGCGYRTTQTICSWIKNQNIASNEKFGTNEPIIAEPSILEIQKILVDCGDKPSNFIGSKEWIGCFESSIVLDCLYNVPCKIVHCDVGNLEKQIMEIEKHFEIFSSPSMMGGNLDSASKGVIGIARKQSNYNLLIADPHCTNVQDELILINDDWISWRSIDSFERRSFYNFCLPQKKAMKA